MSIRRCLGYLSLVALSITIIWIIGAAQIVKANTFLPNGFLASDQVVDNDVFARGPNVTIDGTVNGDVYALSDQVTVNGTVNGSLFILGKQAVIQSKISGTTYALAFSLEFKPDAVLARNLYYIGVSLVTAPGSSIQRDLKTFCLASASLKGTVARDTQVVLGSSRFLQAIMDRFGVNIKLPQSRLPGFGPVSSGTGISTLASPLALFLNATASQTAPPTDTTGVIPWLLENLRGIGLLLVLAAIFLWLFRPTLNRTAEALRARPLAGIGFGFLMLFILFNVLLACLLIAALIAGIVWLLAYLGLWTFAVAFSILGAGTWALFVITLWFVIVYGTQLLVVYACVTWLFGKLLPNVAIPPFLALAIGLIIYVLLRSIPVVGPVLELLVIIWGLGAFWLAYRKSVVI